MLSTVQIAHALACVAALQLGVLLSLESVQQNVAERLVEIRCDAAHDFLQDLVLSAQLSEGSKGRKTYLEFRLFSDLNLSKICVIVIDSLGSGTSCSQLSL